MVSQTSRERGSSVQDRQRDRAARGIGSRQAAAAGAGRPSPPRRRRPALAALAVLLIVGGAALAGLLALRLDSRVDVLVLDTDVAAGEEITADLLRRTPVASEGLSLIPADQADDVIGTYARVPLNEGQLLDTTVLSRTEPFGDEVVQVGVPFATDRIPPGIRSGDEVRLIRLGDGNAEAGPLGTGLVLEVGAGEDDDDLGGSATRGMITLLVSSDAGDAVVDAGGNDRLGMSLLRRGVAAEDADLTALGDR